MGKNLASLGRFAIAYGVYAGFAIYLYQPYFKHFASAKFLIPVSVCFGALGCYVLSRRWIAGFAGSFFSGALYGFGAFILGLSRYHPSISCLIAFIPWLFLPASLAAKDKWRWLSWPLSMVPYIAVIVFFQVSAYYRLFAIPTATKLHVSDLVSLIVPITATKKGLTAIGFYHVGPACFVMGVLMLVTGRRFRIAALVGVGTVLAFCNPFLNISSLMWFSIPAVCTAVLIGVGFQGIISAGQADAKWVLVTVVITLVLSIAAVFIDLQDPSCETRTTFVMYILGAVATGFIYFMARAKLRVYLLRVIILSFAMAVDIFFGARLIVDGTF